VSHYHALIVDDNPKNTAVLAGLLTREDVSSTIVHHPNRLPATLQELDHTDVVFLDLEMPGKSGFDVFEMLKQDERFDGVPIVAYTVHISEMHVVHQHGFHSFIGKPLDADRFPDQLARILRGEQVWERA
jgi:CheY-like chemotaxis protein